jgi:hypothetical protein
MRWMEELLTSGARALDGDTSMAPVVISTSLTTKPG